MADMKKVYDDLIIINLYLYNTNNMSYCYDNQRNKYMAWVKRVYCEFTYLRQLGLEVYA